MLFTRIREASEDGLTGRIALAFAGVVTTCVAAWLMSDAAQQLAYQVLCGGFALIGVYLVGLAFFSRSPAAKPILLSYFFAPVGIVCIAIAMGGGSDPVFERPL